MIAPRHLELPDLAATEEFGRRLASLLFPGAVLALIGALGAGKTHLVRAIAEGLGVPDSRVVTSPTFVLIQEYEGRLPIYHFDVYRLKNLAEFVDLGPHEYWQGRGVCLIEWADKVIDLLPSDFLQITLRIVSPTERTVEVTGVGERYRAMVEAI